MGCCCAVLAAIVPLRIVPNKIVYDVGETGTVEVVVESQGAVGGGADSTELLVEEKWGVEGEGRELWRGEVELKPGERKTFTVPYPGSDVRYGHEVRVTVNPATLQPCNISTSRSEFFNVIDEWWRVNQGCEMEVSFNEKSPNLQRLLAYYGFTTNDYRGSTGGLLEIDGAKKRPAFGRFLSYNTMTTRWQMQKCSVGGNRAAADMPDGVTWITPNGSMPRDSGAIRADSDFAHSIGGRHTRFTINLMEGPYGFELARKRPEWILRNARGQFEGLYMDSRLKPEYIMTPDCRDHYPWTYVEPNFFREDVVDWALDDLDAAVGGFREDGVYFDGRYVKRQGYDAFGNNLQKTLDSAAIAVRNMDKTKAVLLDRHPGRFVWSNGPHPNAPQTSLLDHPRSGLLNELQWVFMLNPSMSCSTYRGFLESCLSSRNMCYLPSKWRKNPGKVHIVGYLCPAWAKKPAPGAYRECWTMGNHAMAVVASALGHPFAGGIAMRPMKQMLTRYSEFVWHEDIEVMKDGYKRFMADSLREIWYDDQIYRRETKDFTEYTIHLVNVPESERCDETTEEDPGEADDVEVSTKILRGRFRAWAIQPYAWEAKSLEPVCAEVAPKTVKGETVFALPPFKYYTLLVIRNYK